MLAPEEFPVFFEEVYGHEPFPWQTGLLRHVAEAGAWPNVLDLPTGSGKTAAIDVAVFHLALEADGKGARRAPVRIAFVVDRRLVVDDAYERAKKLEKALAAAPAGSVVARVAERLKLLSDDDPPLIACRLRGGLPRQSDWARTPAQPTVLCSTVDQVGSRLLFRGYGVSDSMKPVHAGLLGSDCLILLDEAHLAQPFQQTLDWVCRYRGEKWRDTSVHAAPIGVALLTATPGEESGDFSLSDEDRAHPILKARLEAPKRAHLVKAEQGGAGQGEGMEDEGDTSRGGREFARRVETILKEIHKAREHFAKAENGAPFPAIGVVVNRVARAREVHKRLCEALKEEIVAGILAEPILMIGPARPFDRDVLIKELEPIRTRTWKEGETRSLDKPLLLIATQCIEAGVDIDLDALITEAAPVDALRQRFGRLNRAGRKIELYAAIVAGRSDTLARQDDPVYGKAIKPAWDYLDRAAKESDGRVDFGIDAMQALMAQAPVPIEASSPKPCAPILLPAHVDLLSQTWPIPAADPDIALYLHGPDRQPDSIAVVWRADIDPRTHRDDDDTHRLLTLVPPRPKEAIELPIWAVRRWLAGDTRVLERLADVAAGEPEDEAPAQAGREVFRWKGDKERSGWISPSDIRPGDTIVVPARYGGLDKFGWNPNTEEPTTAIDIGQKAAKPFEARRFAVRVAPGLLAKRELDETPEGHALRERRQADALADVLAANASARWREVRDALLTLGLPEDLRRDLEKLDHARKGKVSVDLEVYGYDDEQRPRGVLFIVALGLKKAALPDESEREDGQPNSTEDDADGSMPGFPLPLDEHCSEVAEKAEAFACRAGLPVERIADLKLAGALHDLGKADRRFQALLAFGDPLGSGPTHLLAKSARRAPQDYGERLGLPRSWRHEALSVRLVMKHPRLAEARDPDLVLWLIGSHHGRGRPLFPHPDDQLARIELPTGLGGPIDLSADRPGPQSLAFNWNGLDWPSLFARLKARYGVWELARMEAILRLADHRASEEAAREKSE